MSDLKFPNYLDADRLKSEFFSPEDTESHSSHPVQCNKDSIQPQDPHDDSTEPSAGYSGARLRGYAFAVLTRREYSKIDLIDKLMQRALNRDEVLALVEEFADANYQSDERVAEMTIRSQVRQGKGPYRIKQTLKNKHLDQASSVADLKEVDWHEQAYQLKLKKFGIEVAIEAKIKAKQIRFLQYRGFEMDSIMQAIKRKN